jgi:sortase A
MMRNGALYSKNQKRGSLVVVAIALLGLCLAGCGRSAAAAEPSGAANVPELAGHFVDRRDVPAAQRPPAPFRAPLFHQPDAKPILPSRLLIPAIAADMPVVELGWSSRTTESGAFLTEWDTASYVAGWHKNSSLPGQSGNIVLSGHNNIQGAVFRELDRLQRGDTLQLLAGKRQYTYVVDEILIVPEETATEQQRRENAHYIQPTPDSRLTLISCWPRNANSHRIIVIALPARQAQGR